MGVDGSEPTVQEQFDLTGQVVVVTGGSKGLGKSMALGLAQSGATTVLCARHDDECAEAAEEITDATGSRSVSVPLDVTVEEQVVAGFRRIEEQCGPIAGLVNSAGINARYRIEECPATEFERVLRVNLTGTWLCCREAARHMIPRRAGAVVNVGSALSAVGLVMRTPYCSSKAGILGLTRTLALEWAPHGLRCNALCPGPFLTEINRPLLDDPEKMQAVVGQTALNRWGQLHEIRGAAVFLLSHASSFMTGSALYVDGGWTAH